MEPMYYIGLDVHKQKISYCVKDGGGGIPAARFDLDRSMKTLPQRWSQLSIKKSNARRAPCRISTVSRKRASD